MGLYRQAVFCLEELLTLAPGEPNLHVRYGDALLTLGGAANARTARAYYSKAVQLTGGRSARALYGLTACAAQLQVGLVRLWLLSLLSRMRDCCSAGPAWLGILHASHHAHLICFTVESRDLLSTNNTLMFTLHVLPSERIRRRVRRERGGGSGATQGGGRRADAAVSGSGARQGAPGGGFAQAAGRLVKQKRKEL